jgi:hypothetical protein
MSIMSVRERRRIMMGSDELLFLIGESGELGIVKAAKNMELFIGTPDKEEIVLFLQSEDLIAVSAFDVGDKAEKGIKSMIYLLRELASPIIVLPENHPTSKRLKMVVSCGESIHLNCDIQPGTHPEQDIICACEELSGLDIYAINGGVEIEGRLQNFKLEKLDH